MTVSAFKWFPRSREAKVVTSILAAYTLFFFWLACRKYDAMNSNEGDASSLIQAIWNTVHGKLLYVPCVDMSLLGVHQNYLLLIIAPVYWLFPSVHTILFVQSFLLGVSGVPFYLIARKVLINWPTALFLTVAYLFYPTVVTSHVNQIHGEPLALPFLLAGVYFFLAERFWMFIFFGVLAMMGQENLPLSIGVLGVYAMLRRRRLKWIVAPIILALVYGIVIFKFAIPYFGGAHFAGGRGWMPWYIHSTALGGTPGELLKTVVAHPWQAVSELLRVDSLYLIEILQPLLWILPLFAAEFLLVVPSLGMNLLLDDAYRVIPWHYGPIVGALLCVATIFGIRNVARLLQQRWQLVRAEMALAFCVCCLSVASWPFWLNIGEFVPHSYYPTLKKVLSLVPAGKSVLAPMNMVAHFGERETAMLQMHYDPNSKLVVGRLPEDMYQLDYVILDPNDRRFPPNIVTRDLIMSFYTNVNYELVFNENNVFVFRNRKAVAPR